MPTREIELEELGKRWEVALIEAKVTGNPRIEVRGWFHKIKTFSDYVDLFRKENYKIM